MGILDWDIPLRQKGDVSTPNTTKTSSALPWLAPVSSPTPGHLVAPDVLLFLRLFSIPAKPPLSSLVKTGRKNRTWRWTCLRESNNNKFHKKKLQLGLVYRSLSFNFCKKIASAIVQPSPDSLQWPHGRSTLCMQEILTRQCKLRIAIVARWLGISLSTLSLVLVYVDLFCICTM